MNVTRECIQRILRQGLDTLEQPVFGTLLGKDEEIVDVQTLNTANAPVHGEFKLLGYYGNIEPQQFRDEYWDDSSGRWYIYINKMTQGRLETPLFDLTDQKLIPHGMIMLESSEILMSVPVNV